MQGVECAAWVHEARIAAILGSCPRSSAELMSSVRAYAQFAIKVSRIELPPSIDMLLAWSNLFRSSGTFKNYVTHLRTACQISGFGTDHLYDRLLGKACRAIDKRRGYIARKPMFICFDLVQRIVENASACTDPVAKTLSMAILMTYVFLLRLPSECLPVRTASLTQGNVQHQAVVQVSRDSITLRLRRRKNKEGGSLLKRKCWCATCSKTCPVHVLGRFLLDLGPDMTPFSIFSAQGVLATLRRWLQVLQVPNALHYRTHDIRRGHARDLQQSGSSLLEILHAGEWRSAAFLDYLDKDELECDGTLEAHLNESSDDECER